MKPEMAMHPNTRDAVGKNAEQRFAEIRRYFLEMVEFSNGVRRELYSRPKPGDAREPTEEELVRRWAQTMAVSVNDICIGIQRGFAAAADRHVFVTSFRYCVPHILARANELKESRNGMGSVSAASAGVSVNPKALERERQRAEARRVLGEKESG